MAVSIAAIILPFIAYAIEAPAIHINHLSLQVAAYNQGETVRGAFEIANRSGTNATAVYYVVKLVGDYDEDGIPRIEYSSSRSETFFLGAHEVQTQEFDFSLPLRIAGNVGIEVQAFLEGNIPLGWDHERITISGESSFVTIGDVILDVRGSIYGAQEGPTLWDQGDGRVVYMASNADTRMTVSPVIEIYRRMVGEGEALFAQTLNSITLQGREERQLEFEIPTFGNTPGVYEGVISLAQDGVAVSNQAHFRYIVRGDIATIMAVSSDKEYAATGETVQLFLTIGGTPFDISDDADEEVEMDNVVEIRAALVNENGAVVGEAMMTVDLDEQEDITVPVRITETARALTAHIVVSQGGRTLAERTVSLSSPENDLNAIGAMLSRVETGDYLSGIKGIVVGVLALLAVIAGGAFLARTRRGAVVPIAILIIGVGASFQVLSAYTITDPLWQPSGVTVQTQGSGRSSATRTIAFPRINPKHVYSVQLFINEPKGAICAGEEFRLEGMLTANRCGNQPQFLHVRATFQGTTHTFTSTIAASGGHSRNTRDVRFSLGSFRAPSQPGIYNMEIGVASVRGTKGMGQGYYGYQPIEVRNCSEACVNGASNFPACSICPTGQTLIDGQCRASCEPGTYWDGMMCVSNVPQCPAGSTWDGSQCADGTAVSCPLGYVLQNNQCVLATTPTQCIPVYSCDAEGRLVNSCTGAATLCPSGCVDGMCVSALSSQGSITAIPSLVQHGGRSTIAWTTSGMVADSCVVSENNPELTDAWEGVSGSEISGPIRMQTTYTLSCTQLNGDAFTDSATVRILPVWQEK